MPAMTKRVNIRANVAVRNVNPPIHGTCNDVIMTTGDILKCLCKRAHVEEILPNGTTVTLNMKNYFTDNGAGLFVKKDKPVTEKKPEPKKAPEAPTEAQVVETADEKKEEKPEESVTPPAEPETKLDTNESEEKSNEEAAGVTNEEKEEPASTEEKKPEEKIPVATSGYVAIVGEDDGTEAATVTVSASTEEVEAKTETASTEPKTAPKKTSSKSGSKKSNSSKKK